MLVPQISMSQAVKYPQTEHVNHCFLCQKQWIRSHFNQFSTNCNTKYKLSYSIILHFLSSNFSHEP